MVSSWELFWPFYMHDGPDSNRLFQMSISAHNTSEGLSKSVWKCFLSFTSEKTLGLPAYTCSVWFDSAGWRAAYLPPEQLSNSHKQTPEPLLYVERSTAEGLASPLHNHDLQQKHKEEHHYCVTVLMAKPELLLSCCCINHKLHCKKKKT